MIAYEQEFERALSREIGGVALEGYPILRHEKEMASWILILTFLTDAPLVNPRNHQPHWRIEASNGSSGLPREIAHIDGVSSTQHLFDQS